MKQSIHFVIIAVLFVLVALFVNAYRGARGDAAKLAETLSEQKSVIAQVVDQERDRDKLLASAVAAIQAEKRRVQTPQQAAKAIAQDLPELPLPIITRPPEITIQKPADDLQSTELDIPEPDIKPLYDHLEDCRICTLERDTAKKDLADLQQQTSALTKERDAAIKAAKGGTLWIRIKRAAKWFVIGVAIGATAAAAQHHVR